MNDDSPEPGSTTPGPSGGRGRFAKYATGLVLSFLMGALAVGAGHRAASTAVIDIGPTDGEYASGFRDVERDGPVYFRWSMIPSSTVTAPIRFCSPGVLRLRARRHFVDPAILTVSLGGVDLGRRSVQAGGDAAYEVIELPVSKAICTSEVLVRLESSVSNERPMGVAVDWLQLRAESGFRPARATLLRGGLSLALLSGVLLMAGAGGLALGLPVAALGLALCLTFAADPLAGERVLRGGLAAAALTAILGLLLSRPFGFGSLSSQDRGRLVVITAASLAFRLAFLHPQAFYPDYRVHALVQETYSNLGQSRFMEQLFEIQYARSLGLQQVGGNWYPFPYPPGPYFVISLVQAAFLLDPLDAALATAISAATLLPVVTVALGLKLGLAPGAAVGGALFLALQPLLIRRLALGYFPGVIGQLADALGLLGVLILLSARTFLLPRSIALGGLLLGAFLLYTQSIANFGLFVAMLLAMEVMRRSAHWRGTLRVSIVALLAVVASWGAFYSRYASVMENVTLGRPQPEVRVLDRLDQIRQGASMGARQEGEDDNDPFAGTTLNPLRGVARLGSRLWRFNGPFVLAIIAGLWLLRRGADRPRGNLILAWAAVCVWISLLAAGLPSPNGFQHLKDLEFVSPLFALALSVVVSRLRGVAEGFAWAFCAAWLVFAGWAFVGEFRERLLPMAGL